MFNEEKVAQMAACLLQQRGGCMSYLKLMKLLYLSDRESLSRFGESISGDCMVSMPHGPVLSRTYDFISGASETNHEYGWASWIKDEANYEVSLRNEQLTRNDLDELSDVEIEILDQIFTKFGHMGRFEIRDYTHDHCAEWENPNGSSYPIAPEDVFRAVGKSENEITALLKHHNIQRQLDETLSHLK